MKRILLITLWTLSVVFGVTGPGRAGNDTLTVAMKTRVDTLGLSKCTTRETLILCHNWADTLVYRDPNNLKLVPCLAESYEFVEKNTIEFKLRKGVRFHNGEPFDANAVKTSLNYLRDLKLLPSKPYSHLEKVIVLDDFTVRIISTVHNRLALEAIANILFIYPPQYLQKVGIEGFGRHPVGTGPYRFVSWADRREIVFEANPDYFGGPKGKPRIPNLKVKIIPEELIRIEALLRGKVDLIRGGSVSPDQVPFLEKQPNIKLDKTQTMRIFFLVMDAFGRTGVKYFKDKRVRRAINHAIDKEAIVKKILGGCAKTTDTVTTPFHFGYEKDVMRYSYDPATAKKLLAEAGYPNGFNVDFFFTRDETVAEEISKYLEAVGITTNLKFRDKWRDLYYEIVSGNTPLFFIASGGYSIFDAASVMNLYFPMSSPRCFGSNRQINRLLTQADNTIDTTERKQLLSEAQKIIAGEAFWVPLFYGNYLAVMNKKLDFKQSRDEIDRYFNVSWAFE